MGNIVKIKKGLKENLPILQTAELGYVTDNKELHIGTQEGNVLLCYGNPIILGEVAPIINATFIGQQYIDTTNKVAYIAVSVNDVNGDWKQITVQEVI